MSTGAHGGQQGWLWATCVGAALQQLAFASLISHLMKQTTLYFVSFFLLIWRVLSSFSLFLFPLPPLSSPFLSRIGTHCVAMASLELTKCRLGYLWTQIFTCLCLPGPHLAINPFLHKNVIVPLERVLSVCTARVVVSFNFQWSNSVVDAHEPE